MRLLLISPKFRPSFWNFQMISREILPWTRYTNPPLGLASIAALTPPHWQVTIVDENVEEIDWDFPADVVGVSGMSNQFQRQSAILRRFKERGCYVVAGGNHASLLPANYQSLADTVIAGEAEYIWPRFCQELEEGHPQPLYQETGNVDLTDSPTPRFDLLKLDRYLTPCVQFSRGCPFRCEFCDIIVIFGRRPRTKSLEQVGAELDALRARGVHNVFFVDDNLIGHKPRCKELLRYLIDYQQRHRHQFFFGTEASINLADDQELLELFRAANFSWVFIGIESPSQAALEETLKFQNSRVDLLEAVRTIHRQGISVYAGFIVGFDADTPAVFDAHYRFIQASGISVPMAGLLIAINRTPLWERLERDGRLRMAESLLDGADNTGALTNIEPLNMTYEQLVSGYCDLMRRLFTDEAIFERLANKMRDLPEQPLVENFLPIRKQPGVVWRTLRHAIAPGGWRRWNYFLRSLWWSKGRQARFSAIFDHWIKSIALQEFARTNFGTPQSSPQPVERAMASVQP